MAGAVSTLPSQSSMAAWYNPALLGYTPTRSLVVSLSPNNQAFFNDLSYSNYSVRYQNSIVKKNRTFDWGISLAYANEDFGVLQVTTIDQPEGTGETLPLFSSVSLLSSGISTSFFTGIRVSIGYSLKWYSNNWITFDFDRLLHDFGLITDLSLFDFLGLRIFDSSFLKMDINYRLGYSIHNVGKSYSYNTEFYNFQDEIENNYIVYAMPQLAKLGQSLTLSVTHQAIEVFAVDISRDIFDLQQKNNQQTQSIFSSDISLTRNFFNGKPDLKIETSTGLRFHFLETFSISYGKREFANEWVTINDSDYIYTTYYSKSTYKGFQFHLDGLKKAYLDKQFPSIKPYSLSITYSALVEESNTYSYLKNPTFWGIDLYYRF
ncbi:hypothetical protein EP331_07545 [bacterium]|nr:MAG: hypothetical protein EP331_07545 [bacterium]